VSASPATRSSASVTLAAVVPSYSLSMPVAVTVRARAETVKLRETGEAAE